MSNKICRRLINIPEKSTEKLEDSATAILWSATDHVQDQRNSYVKRWSIIQYFLTSGRCIQICLRSMCINCPRRPEGCKKKVTSSLTNVFMPSDFDQFRHVRRWNSGEKWNRKHENCIWINDTNKILNPKAHANKKGCIYVKSIP